MQTSIGVTQFNEKDEKLFREEVHIFTKMINLEIAKEGIQYP